MSGPESNRAWTEETFRALTEHSADIVSLIDASGRLIFNSAASSRISGFSPEELDGVDTLSFIHPEDRDAVRRDFEMLVASPGRQITVQYRYRHKSGGWTWMEAVATNQLENPAVRAVVANSRDISWRIEVEEERRHIAEQFERSRVLESLATLASGTAHDFNNLLTLILGEAELLKEKPSESECQNALESISNAARRAAELTSLLLAYAGRGRQHCEPVDLAGLIRRREPDLRRIVGSNNQLIVNVDDPIGDIEGNEPKLWQIIESLTVNAAEAFEQSTGTVRITAGKTQLTKQDLLACDFESQLEPGTVVYMEIADTACGMSADVKKRAFDPFFSTKGAGRGLGLAAVAGLVRSFRGSLKVQSEPHQGTTFTLYFQPAQQVTRSEHTLPVSWNGSGLVLVIDDEPQIGDVTARVLRTLGFTTATVASGSMAIQLYGSRLDAVRAVVLDMIMPNMDGGETFRRLREIKADLPVLFYSGFQGDVAQVELKAEGTRFLQKPFSRELLAATLRQLLGE